MRIQGARGRTWGKWAYEQFHFQVPWSLFDGLGRQQSEAQILLGGFELICMSSRSLCSQYTHLAGTKWLVTKQDEYTPATWLLLQYLSL